MKMFIVLLSAVVGGVLGGSGHGKAEKEMKAVCRFKEGEVKGTFAFYFISTKWVSLL